MIYYISKRLIFVKKLYLQFEVFTTFIKDYNYYLDLINSIMNNGINNTHNIEKNYMKMNNNVCYLLLIIFSIENIIYDQINIFDGK